jgi:hypothetical protein
MLLHIGEQRVEVLRRDRLVHLPPVHVLRDVRILDDELVVRRAARVRRGDRDEGAHVRELALVAADGCWIELRGNEVPVHASARTQPLLREAASFRATARCAVGVSAASKVVICYEIAREVSVVRLIQSINGVPASGADALLRVDDGHGRHVDDLLHVGALLEHVHGLGASRRESVRSPSRRPND